MGRKELKEQPPSSPGVLWIDNVVSEKPDEKNLTRISFLIKLQTSSFLAIRFILFKVPRFLALDEFLFSKIQRFYSKFSKVAGCGGVHFSSSYGLPACNISKIEQLYNFKCFIEISEITALVVSDSQLMNTFQQSF